MKYDIRYESGSVREVINLVKNPYRLITSNLYDYEWGYDTASIGSRNGMRVTEFYREKKEFDLELDILASTEEAYAAACQKFLDVTERDVINKTPGRLYVGEWYMSCFLISEGFSDWEYGLTRVNSDLTLLSPYPFWCKEKDYDFTQQDFSISGNWKYPYKYPYRYSNTNGRYGIDNDHFGSSDFVMKIFGPVINPQIYIGQNIYMVNAPLIAGEYLTIDSAAGTIVKTKNTGETENLFYQRYLKQSVFTKIPPGKSNVSWSGRFGFTITLFQERSGIPFCS